jgi:hypothetical protein
MEKTKPSYYNEFLQWKRDRRFNDFDKSLQSINELYLQNKLSDELYEKIIEKAWKKSPIGTIVTRSNGQKWKKVSETGNKDQDWQLVGKPKTGNKTDEPVSKEKRAEYGTKGKQPTISEHAKESSETALNNAIKESRDPEVREAAHQELDRRQKEEHVQEEEKKDGEEKLNEKEIRNKLKDVDSKLKDIENEMKDKLEGLSIFQKAKIKSENKQYSSLITIREELRNNLINVIEKQKEIKGESKKKDITEDIKTSSKKQIEQYNIIQKTNPMLDEYHVGIRSPKDIKNFSEVIKDNESFTWGDFSQEDAKKALKEGIVTVYSSKPIEQGNFISTSKIQAEQYAGGNKLYSKKVNLDDVAWINGDEGQFASLNNKEVKKSESTEKIKGGISDNKSLKEIAQKHDVDIDDIIKELELGIKVEMEHTDDPKVAIEIAKDHLCEFPTYYTELNKMEQSLKEKEKAK